MPNESAAHPMAPFAKDSSSPARVTIVSAVRLYREGIAHALASEQRLEVVAECADYAAVLEQQPACCAQVILIDSAILMRHGLVRVGGDDSCDVPLVAFGVPEHDDAALTCARLGARGLVAASAPLADVVIATRTVLGGELYCSHRLIALFVREVARLPVPEPPSHSPPLTRREGEIATLLETGASNKEIARRLGIEVATVKTHVHSVLAKLQVHRRAEAAARAAWRGQRSRTRLVGSLAGI